MPNKKITMQDIADACGFSRNTVSKVFNGRGSVPENTREVIVRTAAALGYGAPAGNTASFPTENRTIALFTGKLPVGYHFGAAFITAFTDHISRAGFTLKIFELSREELQACRLPLQFFPEQIAGIISIELFSRPYLEMLCRLKMPTVVIDGPMYANSDMMPCDFLIMENIAAVTLLVRGLIASGAKRLGFVGDRNHCESFYERWLGFATGLQRSGLPVSEEYCILDEDSAPYDRPEWLLGRIDSMPGLPDAFVCANDYLAVHLMSALRKRGLSIPGDIQVTGFDGLPQAAVTEPPLTTVAIPVTDIGRMAGDVLLFRMRHADLPFHWVHVKSTPVWRESTKKAARETDRREE